MFLLLGLVVYLQSWLLASGQVFPHNFARRGNDSWNRSWNDWTVRSSADWDYTRSESRDGASPRVYSTSWSQSAFDSNDAQPTYSFSESRPSAVAPHEFHFHPHPAHDAWQGAGVYQVAAAETTTPTATTTPPPTTTTTTSTKPIHSFILPSAFHPLPSPSPQPISHRTTPPHDRSTRAIDIFTSYAGVRRVWTRWSAWSPCSSSCGPGLRRQQRYCVVTSANRVLRQASSAEECDSASASQGSERFKVCSRYKPCYSSELGRHVRDPREPMCLRFNNRTYNGQNYSWLPAPVDKIQTGTCDLFCQPKGEKFYIHFGRVPDGFPCTLDKKLSKQKALAAACVNQTCQVGRTP